MAYSQKHKQATMDFFDKMQEKMQVKDSKRRKLSKQTTSSQPELMFLQFKPKHEEQYFGMKPQYMSQQTNTKKTWKPPTKVCSNETTIIDVGRKKNEKHLCTNLSFMSEKDPKKVNETDNIENENEHYTSHQESTKNSSFTTMLTESTNNISDQIEVDDTQLDDQILNVPVYDLGVCKEESEKLKSKLSGSTCTMYDSVDVKQSNLHSERPNKQQLQCFSYDSGEHLSDQENIATQENPKLSKALDSSHSETCTQVHNNDRKSYEDQNKEDSDIEDIQLINSIDLILSENQQNQTSQNESNSENYIYNNESKKNSTSNCAVVESQCTVNEIAGKCLKVVDELGKCKASVEIEKLSLDTDSNNKIITSNVTTSSKSSLEQTPLHLEISDRNETVSTTLSKDKNLRNDNIHDENDSSKNEITNIASSVLNNKSLLQSDGLWTHRDSSSCIDNHDKDNDTPSKSCERFIHMNASDMIQKATKQIKIDHFYRLEGCTSVERRVGEGISQSVQGKQLSDKKESEKGLNKIVVENYEAHGSVGTKVHEEVDALKENVRNEENNAGKVDGDEEDLDEFKYKENKTDYEEDEGFSKISDLNKTVLDDAVNKQDAEVNDEDERKQKCHLEESELYDKDKNGFDDDYSCLMISNSQLMELERKYYELPGNLKSPSLTTTTLCNNLTDHMKNSIGVQTEGVIMEMLPSNFDGTSTALPPPTAPTAQWTKKVQETQRQLRDTIQEVGRLNSILMKIRQELWPHSNMIEANKF